MALTCLEPSRFEVGWLNLEIGPPQYDSEWRGSSLAQNPSRSESQKDEGEGIALPGPCSVSGSA